MKTSAQWWAECKADPEKFVRWLQRQYTGEVTAAQRIADVFAKYPPDNGKWVPIIDEIVHQERQHADWIAQLLRVRGFQPQLEESDKRYWAETLPGIDDFFSASAVAAHAEAMRLERIKVIAEDSAAAEDVRNTFARILRDELFHERAFRTMTSPEAYEASRGNHAAGREALGLVP